MTTGRTVGKWVDFIIDDVGGTLRSIPVSTIGGLGVAYDEIDMTALQDAVKSILPGHPDMALVVSGPWDTSALASVGTLSGSHTVLHKLNGQETPLTLDVQIGIRTAWDSGEPQFGITSSSTNGVLVHVYNVDMESNLYTATIVMAPGSAIPAWGTAAET
jgi:hypothetical protein